LLGFATALLAHNVLALVQRCVEQAHQPPPETAPPETAPPETAPEVSCFHLAQHIKSGYEGLLIAVPPEHWPSQHDADPARLAERLLHLARHIDPRRVALSKRKPKPKTPKGYVDGATARAHVATHASSPKPEQEDPERGGA
jgi:hypothetical protein